MTEQYEDLSPRAFKTFLVCDSCGKKEFVRITGRPGHESEDANTDAASSWGSVERELPGGRWKRLIVCSAACEQDLLEGGGVSGVHARHQGRKSA